MPSRGKRLSEGSRGRSSMVWALLPIMEDDPHSISMSGAKPTDSVTQINTIGSLDSLNWAMADGKSNAIALLQAHHFGAGLHPRTLLGQYELASSEILAGHGKKESYLNRENIFAVNILVQRIP